MLHAAEEDRFVFLARHHRRHVDLDANHVVQHLHRCERDLHGLRPAGSPQAEPVADRLADERAQSVRLQRIGLVAHDVLHLDVELHRVADAGHDGRHHVGRDLRRDGERQRTVVEHRGLEQDRRGMDKSQLARRANDAVGGIDWTSAPLSGKYSA